MKKILLLFIVSSFFTMGAMAQVPELMSYQAAIRNSNNELLVNKQVGVRISLIQGSPNGNVSYRELHNTTTNTNGLISFQIGAGTPVSGQFSNINWSNGPFFVKTEADPNGGTNYRISSVSQLLTVPYALYAKNFEMKATRKGDMMYWDGTKWNLIPAGIPGQTLMLSSDNTPLWGGIITLPRISSFTADLPTYNGVTLNGIIQSNGGSPIIKHGVCWSTSQNPTDTLLTKMEINADSPAFSFRVTNLDSNTTYYAKAYAENVMGKVYTNEISFNTIAAGLPNIIIDSIFSVGPTFANASNNIINYGGDLINERGICWSITENPTKDLATITNDAPVNGSLNSSISNLIANTTYHVRAYATNSFGTSYSNDITFRTSMPSLPAVSTLIVDTVLITTATGGGNITSNGGSPIIAKGLCWSTSVNPTISLTTKSVVVAVGDNYISTMTNLMPNTTYYVRAYATNVVGTSYGENVSFRTEPSPLNIITNVGASRIFYTYYRLMPIPPYNPPYYFYMVLNGGYPVAYIDTLGNQIGTGASGSGFGSAGGAPGPQDYPSVLMPPKPNIVTFSGSIDTVTNSSTVVDIYETGFCWKSSSGTTINDNIISLGSGIGSFSGSLNNLAENQTIFLKLYCKTNIGILYGNEISYTHSKITEPTITSVSSSQITSSSIRFGGQISTLAESIISERGVCWSTSPNPTINNYKTTDGNGWDGYSHTNLTGTYQHELTNLIPNTTYYVRAYVTNAVASPWGTNRFNTKYGQEYMIRTMP